MGTKDRLGEISDLLALALTAALFAGLFAVLFLFSLGVVIDARTPPVYETKAGVVEKCDIVILGNPKSGFQYAYYITVANKQYEVSQGDYKRISVGSWLKFKVRVNGVFSHKIIVEAVE